MQKDEHFSNQKVIEDSSTISIVTRNDDEIQQGIKRMVNGYEVSKYFARFICLEKIFALCLLLQLAMSFLYYEAEYCDMEDYYYDFILKMLFALMCFTLVFCGLAHKSFNDLKIAENKEHEIIGLQSIVIKFFIIVIQPYTVFQDFQIKNWHYFANKYELLSVNYLLVLLSIFKIVLLVPCLLNTLKFKNPRSSRVCKIYGCSNSYLFETKCYFKECPVKTITIIFVGFILIFSFAFRVAERSKYDPTGTYNIFQNSLWLVVITMTSVGFGDFFPKTLIGRIVGVFCTICGVLIVSVIVVVVTNTFQLTQRENTSLKIIKKLEQKKQLKQIAAKYISISVSRIYRNKQRLLKNPYAEVEKQTFKQRDLRKQFRLISGISKFNESFSVDLGEEMNRNFQRSFFQIENLKSNFDVFLKYLSDKYFININNIKDEKMGHSGIQG